MTSQRYDRGGGGRWEAPVNEKPVIIETAYIYICFVTFPLVMRQKLWVAGHLKTAIQEGHFKG